jgi:signal transduction histidine kinase
LQAWPLAVRSSPGWYQIKLVRDGNLHTTRALFFELPSGFRLLVGRDVEDRVEVRGLIVSALGWSSLGALILAVVGGSLVRGAVLRRVEAINRTASAIVLGDLSHRVPTRGSSDEFDRLARTINAMLEQIQHLIEGVRNATNVVAHDLRTPLAELRTRLETLITIRPPLAETYEEIYGAVSDIDRIVNIFNALLRLAEIDSGVRRAGFRRVELAGVTTELMELYEPLAEEKRVALTVDAPEGIAVRGDPDLLAQAIGNLVDNAIKYTPCGGMVALQVSSDTTNQVAIAVVDTGPGISDAEKARATERFYRGNRASGTEGTGLGLSVVDAVARLHNGVLTLIDNRPGLGAVLTLPRDVD